MTKKPPEPRNSVFRVSDVRKSEALRVTPLRALDHHFRFTYVRFAAHETQAKPVAWQLEASLPPAEVANVNLLLNSAIHKGSRRSPHDDSCERKVVGEVYIMLQLCLRKLDLSC
nr:hypothetical protein CFP56_60650 [Quercus suber]